MHKNNPNYWLERLGTRRMHKAHDKGTDTVLRLAYAHDRATKKIQEDIEHMLGTFQANTNVNRMDALNILNTQIDNQEYEKLLELYQTTQNPLLKNELKKKLNAQPLQYRISRKQALQDALYLNAIERADYEIEQSEKLYKSIAKQNYYESIYDQQRVTGEGFYFDGIDNKRINEMMANNWSGKHYSERVWNNSRVIEKKFFDVITEGYLTGKSSRMIAQDLEDFTMYGKHATERLVRTELSYFVNQSELESAKAIGIKYRIFNATLDLKTSDICQNLDNKRIKIEDVQIGVNAPPMHPNCRSIMISEIEGLTHSTRRAIDPQTEKPMNVPFDMNYQEWYDKYVQEPSLNWKRQAQINKSQDGEQYRRYTDLIGIDKLPKSLKDFQMIKYTDGSEYGILKSQYKGVGYYNKLTQNEPFITSQVMKIAKETDMKILGLEFRMKGKDSYLRKIRSNYNPSGNDYEVKDIVRYTLSAEKDMLTKKTFQSFDALTELGYNISEVKNTWFDGSPYKGINCVIRDEQGTPFELQFHTQESFDLKNGPLHVLYEEQRLLAKGSNRWNEIQDEMVRMSMLIENPTNIKKVRK